MNVNNYDPNLVVSKIAAAIGEPARLRILHSLLDGRARTSTELAVVAEVTPSTTSVHLNRLKAERLVTVLVQVRGVVMEISQDETDIGRNFAQEIGSRLTRHATLAGVSTAAMGNQTAATTETTCSFQS